MAPRRGPKGATLEIIGDELREMLEEGLAEGASLKLPKVVKGAVVECPEKEQVLSYFQQIILPHIKKNRESLDHKSVVEVMRKYIKAWVSEDGATTAKMQWDKLDTDAAAEFWNACMKSTEGDDRFRDLPSLREFWAPGAWVEEKK